MMHNRAKSLLASGVLFVLALFLTAYSSRRPASSRIGQEALLQLSSPFALSADFISSKILRAVEGFQKLKNLREQNLSLEKDNDALRSELSELRELASETQRLRSLVQMIEPRSFRGKTARIVGRSVSPWRREIMIAAGSNHGIQRGQGVISARGVVGRVSAVAPSVSRVLLISDPSSGVAALLSSNRAPGIVVGRGEQAVELRYLPPDVDVLFGAEVVTSGFDTVFPSGISIGTVLEVKHRTGALFHQVTIRPGIDESFLEEVFVLSPEGSEDRSALFGSGQKPIGEQRSLVEAEVWK